MAEQKPPSPEQEEAPEPIGSESAPSERSHGVEEALRTTASDWPPSPEGRQRAPILRSRDIIKGAAVVLAMYVFMRLLWNVYALAIVAFLGVLFGLAVSRAVEPLARLRVPRGLAAGVVVLGVMLMVGGVIAWTAPTLVTQYGELRQRLPQAIDKVDAWIESKRGGILGALIEEIEEPGPGAQSQDSTPVPIAQRDPRTGLPTDAARTSPQSQTTQERSGVMRVLFGRLVGSGQRYLFPFITSAFTVVAATVLTIMLAIYVAADPGLYHRGVMHLVPHRQRARIGELLSRMATVLRRWLRAQLIGMVVIGFVTTVALYWLDIPAALPLGILAGILEFIPNVGPLIAAAPAVLMGFIDSPQKALWVAVTYFIIQQLESQFLVPLIMQEGLDLPPVLTILAQALMAIVFGFLGLLVAVPLLAIVMVAVKMLYVEGVVGDVIDDEESATA